MASNIANVTATVTVKIDDSLRERVIGTLERAKREHDTDGCEGLYACPAITYRDGKHGCDDSLCECGAAGINAEIDALIVELRKPPDV